MVTPATTVSAQLCVRVPSPCRTQPVCSVNVQRDVPLPLPLACFVQNQYKLCTTEVVNLELMGKPPKQRAPHNPWPHWPMVFKACLTNTGALADWGQTCCRTLLGSEPISFMSSHSPICRWIMATKRPPKLECCGSPIFLSCVIFSRNLFESFNFKKPVFSRGFHPVEQRPGHPPLGSIATASNTSWQVFCSLEFFQLQGLQNCTLRTLWGSDQGQQSPLNGSCLHVV